MDIAQATLTVFDVGLQKINRPAVAFMTRPIFRQLFLDKSINSSLDHASFDGLVKLLVEVDISAQVASVQEGGLYFHVRSRQRQGFFDRASGVTNLKPGVPQRIEEPFRHRFNVGRDFP